MIHTINISETGKNEKYKSLIPQIENLVKDESDFIANVSNIISVLKYTFNFLWIGVYFVKQDKNKNPQLVLGPFQGTVACTRIGYGKGVCGTSWKNKQAIIVDDVEQFPGHIACSSFSKSEIVLPAFNQDSEVFLVLDIDSEHLTHFDNTDKMYLQKIVSIIENCAQHL